jgi:phosphoribosylamine--glycine ligase
MGSFSPVSWLADGIVAKAEQRVAVPLINLMAEKGIDFRGVLFSGLMVVGGEPYCLEYNVRFGDPETQTIVRRLGKGFAYALWCVARGEEIPEFEVLDNSVVTVVLASEGYPGKYKKGRKITIPEKLPDDVVVFHAGTEMLVDDLVSSGGRVLAVSSDGPSLAAARESAYHAADQIEFKGKQYRSDIGS